MKKKVRAASLDRIRQSRDLPFIKRGMRVEVDGKPGRICSCNISDNLNIRLDGERRSRNCHPYYRVKYFDQDGKVIKDFGESPF